MFSVEIQLPGFFLLNSGFFLLNKCASTTWQPGPSNYEITGNWGWLTNTVERQPPSPLLPTFTPQALFTLHK